MHIKMVILHHQTQDLLSFCITFWLSTYKITNRCLQFFRHLLTYKSKSLRYYLRLAWSGIPRISLDAPYAAHVRPMRPSDAQNDTATTTSEKDEMGSMNTRCTALAAVSMVCVVSRVLPFVNLCRH